MQHAGGGPFACVTLSSRTQKTQADTSHLIPPRGK
jgi:hypothetical protein